MSFPFLRPWHRNLYCERENTLNDFKHFVNGKADKIRKFNVNQDAPDSEFSVEGICESFKKHEVFRKFDISTSEDELKYFITMGNDDITIHIEQCKTLKPKRKRKWWYHISANDYSTPKVPLRGSREVVINELIKALGWIKEKLEPAIDDERTRLYKDCEERKEKRKMVRRLFNETQWNCTFESDTWSEKVTIKFNGIQVCVDVTMKNNDTESYVKEIIAKLKTADFEFEPFEKEKTESLEPFWEDKTFAEYDHMKDEKEYYYELNHDNDYLKDILVKPYSKYPVTLDILHI